MITMTVGFDQREAIAYHAFCQSVLEKASLPVSFIPLAEKSLAGYRESHTDGSNKFVYSRFLTPHLNGFSGWAIYADGDMVCTADIAELWRLRDPGKAVQVVKHDYLTKAPVKYLGHRNENYPRKNWSSVVLWNCGHPANRCLTPEFIQDAQSPYLHRFSWLDDSMIGALPIDWNWLAIEYGDRPQAKLIHYTLGTPCFREYAQSSMSPAWWDVYRRTVQGLDD